ncbi:type IV pilus assembly protein FimV [Ghiorsea bivora]|uniref:type IV pilus assembly protein FimV n=1 Tax=Ghiorsea bivora TaxID=1485545 RepID=UPI0012FDE60A|nr:FimV/HubP family polar landmark protein [Ghiorsea bivora]
MKKCVLILFFLLFCSQQTLAMGFGQASLHSHLGEPLDVRVPLIMEKGETVQQFKVQLATPSEYLSLEQVPPQSYHDIRVDIQISASSTAEVYIHSSYAVDEAILVLVLKVKRGRGVFYKKMQFFLDALDIQPTKKTSWVSRPNEAVKYTASQQPQGNQTEFLQTPTNQNIASFARTADWSRRSSYGPVQYGDSLSEIAYRLRKDKRWSNQQIMLALFDANPEAFVHQDINQLKKGRFLKVPDDVAVKQFVNSERYQSLKALLHPVKAQENNRRKVGESASLAQNKQAGSPSFRGRISLGLHEDLAMSQENSEVLQRLDKLEPMYQQAMATGLRLDGMDTKVEALAKELGQLRHKVDALSRIQTRPAPESGSYAWFWFFGLLLLNIVLFAVYFYRKQMKSWQNKLIEAQQSMLQSVANGDVKDVKNYQNIDSQTSSVLEQNKEAWDDENQVVGLDEYDSMVGDDVSGTHDNQGLDVISIGHMPSVAEADVDHDYVSLFEEAVHKKDWQQAEKYYALMDDKESSRPRIQALWVEKLHRSNNIMERNLTLLNLSRLYEYDQWHRFCSYFDQDIWHELQDEKVISYTGKVVEPEMDKMNQQLMASEQGIDKADPVLDLSEAGRFDITVQDFQVGIKDSVDNAMLDTWDEKGETGAHKVEQALEDDSIVGMCRVDADDIEPIAKDDTSALALDFDFELDTDLGVESVEKYQNLTKGVVNHINNGEDDTVMVTPKMLDVMEAKKAESIKKEN